MHEEKDRVVAIGEVGLDYPGAKTAVLRENQELFWKEFLTAGVSDEDSKDLPLVLHVKDMSFDKQDASARCLSIPNEVGYPVSHIIYRHSFLGTRRGADAWIKAFPNVVFFFSFMEPQLPGSSYPSTSGTRPLKNGDLPTTVPAPEV